MAFYTALVLFCLVHIYHICDVSSWYTMLTEVLCCGPCTKATRNKEGGTVGRWLAWDLVILSQLSEAHPAMFPAVLTCKRGVDKNVVRLLWDRTEGNTMVKVWRQVQENHHEEYLHRKDLYTILMMSTVEPRGIVSSLGHTFRPPPPSRELPSTRLLRHAFLLAEADNVQHYRNQILSTFGTVLKMDSTKKVFQSFTVLPFQTYCSHFSQLMMKYTSYCCGLMTNDGMFQVVKKLSGEAHGSRTDGEVSAGQSTGSEDPVH
ncbi:uncharacterized protein LOC105354665 [Oryzias latipes]|uniref:uncharacterized protein LOC105354665 n=1 Tax=Oryzias latipes TaxID=8090 RepID=UPI000CE1BD83|nr:uncharacterized protein LOC105354665 [Oryzias latipes]